MPSTTYFVALPFVRTEDGDLVPGEPKEMRDGEDAKREAARMALGAAGAVAFSRTGDPTTGDFEDAKIIARFGDTGDINA